MIVTLYFCMAESAPGRCPSEPDVDAGIRQLEVRAREKKLGTHRRERAEWGVETHGDRHWLCLYRDYDT